MRRGGGGVVGAPTDVGTRDERLMNEKMQVKCTPLESFTNDDLS